MLMRLICSVLFCCCGLAASVSFVFADATVTGFFREDLVSSGFFEGHKKQITPAVSANNPPAPRLIADEQPQELQDKGETPRPGTPAIMPAQPRPRNEWDVTEKIRK